MANTYDTSAFPLGSKDPRVLYNNASNLDDAVNSALTYWVDRFGKNRKSWTGLEQMFNDFMNSMGFEPTHLTYVLGTPLQVDRPTQLIDYAGSVYKVKSPANFPVSLTGDWEVDSDKLVDVGDASLRAALASAAGSSMVGFGDTTAETILGNVSRGEIWADDPRYAGSLSAAISELTNGSTLHIRGTFSTTAPLLFSDLEGLNIVFHPTGYIQAASAWQPTIHRGVLIFDSCTKVNIYRPDIKGACVAHPTDNADGDAGIEFIECEETRIYAGYLRNFMTWGVIHIGCKDTLVNGTKIRALTQQSGVGHADCIKYVVHECDIQDVGLYGVECEGVNNQDGTVTDNDISLCFKGIAAVRGANSTIVKRNRIKSCDVALSMNSVLGAQILNTFKDNELLNNRVEYELVGSRFCSVTSNRGTKSVVTEYLHRSPEDYISLVVSGTQVRVRSTLGTIAVGDVHRYAAGDYQVIAVSNISDARYGTIQLVTYPTTVGLSFGAAFRKAVNLSDSRFMAQILGDTQHLTFRDNEGDGYSRAYFLGGSIDASHIGPNQVSNTAILFDTADAVPATNTKFVIKEGDVTNALNIAFGDSVAKVWPSLVCERRTLTMGKASATGFTLPVAAMLTKVRLAIFTSSSASAPVVLSLGGAPIITIPAAEFGLGVPVTRELIMSTLSASFTFDVTGGGAMTFATATLECSILNVN